MEDDPISPARYFFATTVAGGQADEARRQTEHETVMIHRNDQRPGKTLTLQHLQTLIYTCLYRYICTYTYI